MEYPLLGTTFSHRKIQDLKLSVTECLIIAFDLNFSHLRLGCYWDEIEKVEGDYDFSQMEKILSECDKIKQKVILTVGVKAPRWPEYYWPKWLNSHDLHSEENQQKIITFIEKCVSFFKKYSCVDYWQLENEPLDPSGPENLTIPQDFLSREISLLKRIDDRKLLISFWMDNFHERSVLEFDKKVNMLGIDLYYRQFINKIIGKSVYKGPLVVDSEILKIKNKLSSGFIVSELQAEPWEESEEIYLSGNGQSMSVEILQNNFKKACRLNPSEILFWGFEYWCYRKFKGDLSYLNYINSLIKK